MTIIDRAQPCCFNVLQKAPSSSLNKIAVSRVRYCAHPQAEEARPRRGAQHDQSDPQRPRHRAPAAGSLGGVQPLVLPAWSPNLNAFAERFVKSAKSECLDRIVPLVKGTSRLPYEHSSSIIMRSDRSDHTRVWATSSSRRRRRRSAQARSRAARGSATCSSSTTRGRVTLWAEFSHTGSTDMGNISLANPSSTR
jgi:hypothetical protein